MSLSFYPASPKSVDPGLTKLPTSYQWKAIFAILAIIVFFVLYLALVVGLAFLTYYAIVYPIENVNKLTILGKIGAIAGSAMLFVFTLKFILKLKNHKPENRIKLVKGDHENLFAFVDRICAETGAPRPKAIYVDPDVNAYVAYSNSWLSLFLPVRKELTIGLGLVSCLNLSEFKAVIAHEFGHFAQRSMKIGSYIMSANTIIHDMIFQRDKWDEMLAQWRGSDIRISFAAWLITPVVWVIRQLLNLFYQFLNIMYASLSREMEFNADKVAVSITGSEGIISALWKLDNGFTHWNNTINHAYVAGQKSVYTKNIYKAYDHALYRNSAEQRELKNRLPEDIRGGRRYFSTNAQAKVGMYASHPPNNLREENAKIPFIHCVEDERSPWILFNADEILQQRMSALIYKTYLNKNPDDYVSSSTFEEFVRAETEGAEILEEYENTFHDRFLSIPPKDDLQRAVSHGLEPTNGDLAKLKSDLKILMKPINDLNEKANIVSQIAQGTSKLKSIELDGQEYRPKQMQQAYMAIMQKREKLFQESFEGWDADFCFYQLKLAKKNGRSEELLKRLEQHREITDFFKTIMSTKNFIYGKLEELQNRSDVTEAHVSFFADDVNKSIDELNAKIDKLTLQSFIPLPNIASRDELLAAIVKEGTFQKGTRRMFENGQFDKILFAIDAAANHCQRLDQKSISAILLSQKEGS